MKGDSCATRTLDFEGGRPGVGWGYVSRSAVTTQPLLDAASDSVYLACANRTGRYLECVNPLGLFDVRCRSCSREWPCGSSRPLLSRRSAIVRWVADLGAVLPWELALFAPVPRLAYVPRDEVCLCLVARSGCLVALPLGVLPRVLGVSVLKLLEPRQ